MKKFYSMISSGEMSLSMAVKLGVLPLRGPRSEKAFSHLREQRGLTDNSPQRAGR